jgi:hypothetical protein
VRTERKSARANTPDGEDYLDLDSLLVRHPLAKGVLTLPEGILWAGGWALVAMVGAWLLNPVCFYIFLAGGLLEAVYCLLVAGDAPAGADQRHRQIAGRRGRRLCRQPAAVDHLCDGPGRLDLLLGDRRAEHPQRLDRHRRGPPFQRPGPSPFNWAWRGPACWP